MKIVFEVPSESSTLNFGVLLVGTGDVWMDDFKLIESRADKKKTITDLDVTLRFN